MDEVGEVRLPGGLRFRLLFVGQIIESESIQPERGSAHVLRVFWVFWAMLRTERLTPANFPRGSSKLPEKNRLEASPGRVHSQRYSRITSSACGYTSPAPRFVRRSTCHRTWAFCLFH